MGYTLKAFLESNITPVILLRTDPLDFEQIVIKGISVQEIPLDDFIQEGELVLSTALGSDLDPGRILQLVQGAASAKAAAVLFSFKGNASLIPQDVVDYGNENNIPIFEIPWSYRFSTIQTEVLTAIREDALITYKGLQNKLFNQFFDGQDLNCAARSISETFRCPVRIVTPQGMKLGVCENFDASFSGHLLQIEILLSGTLFGYLELILSADAAPEQRIIFEQYLAFPLSMWFSKKSIEDFTKTRLKNDFVQNLSSGNYESFDTMVQQGLRLNFDLSKPYTCIAMRIFLSGKNASVPEYSNEIAKKSLEIEHICLREGARRNLKTMVANRSLEFTIYIENTHPDPYETIMAYIDNVNCQIQKNYPTFRCFWGISEISFETPDFIRLYTNASLTLRYCLNAKDGQTRLMYKDTKKAQIVSVLSEHQEILQSAQEVLQDLLDYDADSRVGLFQTLTEYIRTNYNISQTARNLHIHRQSLLYRLEKIESLTGLSLNSHDNLFVLEVFSRIYSTY